MGEREKLSDTSSGRALQTTRSARPLTASKPIPTKGRQLRSGGRSIRPNTRRTTIIIEAKNCDCLQNGEKRFFVIIKTLRRELRHHFLSRESRDTIFFSALQSFFVASMPPKYHHWMFGFSFRSKIYLFDRM